MIRILTQIKFSTLLLLLCLNIQVSAQNTVGLLSYNPSKAFDGYNLIYPHNQPNVYLIDNCGEVVHTWTDDADFRPGNMATILDDGRLVKTKRGSIVTTDPIWAGGGSSTLEIRDWDNNLDWSMTINDENERLHHDFVVTPSGTILAIVWELKTAEEAAQAGRDTSTLLTQGELWPDKIIEIDPTTDEIIWEWHAWDHLIQDFDPTKDNYGVVADHPELIDINYDTNDGQADWMHTNAIDYQPVLDQIMISVPTFSEVWIIDHGTTTAEAAGHTAGFLGKGGDLHYRWGNPLAYKKGTAADQKLFYQHDTHWADRFITPANPNFNKIVAFNNRFDETYSTLSIFDSGFDMYAGNYPLGSNGLFLPETYTSNYSHPVPTTMHSTGLSSGQILPNGNTLICVGRTGYSFEVDMDGSIVWEYKTPLIGGFPATQGDTLALNNNLTFFLERYPTDFEGFNGKDLTPSGWIELEPNETFCATILPVYDLIDDFNLKIYPNPASGVITMQWEGGRYSNIEVVDLMGRRQMFFDATGGRKFIDVSQWDNGVYFIRVDGKSVKKLIVAN